MGTAFPNISVSGDKVNAKDYIEKGTGFHLFLACLVALVGGIFAIAISYGVLLIVLIFYPLFAGYIRKKAMARIHGSGVKVGPSQFPQIHESFLSLKERLSIHKDVHLYIVEDNVLNASAVRYGKDNVILLTDDLIQGCLVSGMPQSLSFIIAHELGHIALNHNGVFRSWLGHAFKKLGRLDEYSCDSVARVLVKDKDCAFHGLLLLTVGWALLPYLNPETLKAQAAEVALNKYSVKAERPLTHPLLLNRIHRILSA